MPSSSSARATAPFRTTLVRGSVLALTLLAGAGVPRASELTDDPADRSLPLPAAQGFALVELFTSEGCSSCPPADRLLARIHADARPSGRAVEALSFHVDYWNDLGWRDPFSSAAASQRQRWYGQKIQPHNVYTPQLVVNGTTAFVGSDAATAGQAVGAALAGGSGEGGIGLVVQPTPGGRALSVQYRLPGGVASDGTALVLAWAQDAARGQPTRGENSGRTLDHVGVVRDFRVLGGTGALPAAGQVLLARPSGGPGRVVGFLQDRRTARVLALEGVAVP